MNDDVSGTIKELWEEMGMLKCEEVENYTAINDRTKMRGIGEDDVRNI